MITVSGLWPFELSEAMNSAFEEGYVPVDTIRLIENTSYIAIDLDIVEGKWVARNRMRKKNPMYTWECGHGIIVVSLTCAEAREGLERYGYVQVSDDLRRGIRNRETRLYATEENLHFFGMVAPGKRLVDVLAPEDGLEVAPRMPTGGSTRPSTTTIRGSLVLGEGEAV